MINAINSTNLAVIQNRLFPSIRVIIPLRDTNPSPPPLTFSASHFSKRSIRPVHPGKERTRVYARKALIDRGIRLLTSNQLANNTHATWNTIATTKSLAPRHYWTGNREREREKVSSRGGLLKLRLLLISSSVSSKLHRIRRLPTPLNY